MMPLTLKTFTGIIFDLSNGRFFLRSHHSNGLIFIPNYWVNSEDLGWRSVYQWHTLSKIFQRIRNPSYMLCIRSRYAVITLSIHWGIEQSPFSPLDSPTDVLSWAYSPFRSPKVFAGMSGIDYNQATFAVHSNRNFTLAKLQRWWCDRFFYRKDSNIEQTSNSAPRPIDVPWNLMLDTMDCRI